MIYKTKHLDLAYIGQKTQVNSVQCDFKLFKNCIQLLPTHFNKSLIIIHVCLTAPIYVCPSNVQQGASRGSTKLFVNEQYKMCYEMVIVPETWQNAENDCIKKGGHLVTISSATDEHIVYQYVRAYGHETWIGLNDLKSEETFTWTSGIVAYRLLFCWLHYIIGTVLKMNIIL